MGEFAPKFAAVNDDVLFGEVWSRTAQLSARDRSIVTVTALLSTDSLDSSLEHRIRRTKANSVTQEEITEVITHAAFYSGWPKAGGALRIAKDVYAE